MNPRQSKQMRKLFAIGTMVDAIGEREHRLDFEPAERAFNHSRVNDNQTPR